MFTDIPGVPKPNSTGSFPPAPNTPVGENGSLPVGKGANDELGEFSNLVPVPAAVIETKGPGIPNEINGCTSNPLLVLTNEIPPPTPHGPIAPMDRLTYPP